VRWHAPGASVDGVCGVGQREGEALSVVCDLQNVTFSNAQATWLNVLVVPAKWIVGRWEAQAELRAASMYTKRSPRFDTTTVVGLIFPEGGGDVEVLPNAYPRAGQPIVVHYRVTASGRSRGQGTERVVRIEGRKFEANKQVRWGTSPRLYSSTACHGNMTDVWTCNVTRVNYDHDGSVADLYFFLTPANNTVGALNATLTFYATGFQPRIDVPFVHVVSGFGMLFPEATVTPSHPPSAQEV